MGKAGVVQAGEPGPNGELAHRTTGKRDRLGIRIARDVHIEHPVTAESRVQRLEDSLDPAQQSVG